MDDVTLGTDETSAAQAPVSSSSLDDIDKEWNDLMSSVTNKEPQPEQDKPIDDPVSEEIVDQQEPEKLENKEDHPANQGRKIKKLEDDNQELLKRLELLEQTRSGYQEPQIQQQPTFDDDEFESMQQYEPCPVDIISSPADQLKVNRWMERVQEKKNQVFAKLYLDTASTLKDIGGDYHDQVVQMITTAGSPYYKTYTKMQDGKQDAEKNYRDALINVMHEQLGAKTKTKPVANWNNAPSSNGVTKPTDQIRPTTTKKEVDRNSKFYMVGKEWGLDDDEIVDAVSSGRSQR
jgi:hypothetical protein